jgi:hypothetical protein
MRHRLVAVLIVAGALAAAQLTRANPAARADPEHSI